MTPLSPRLSESFVGFSLPGDSRSACGDGFGVVVVVSVTLASTLGWFPLVSPELFG